MKKKLFVLVLILGIVAGVFCQNSGSGDLPGSANLSGPMDLVVILDTSASMSNSYADISNYLVGPFLREFLRIGDTFHLISFSDAPRLEISRRISAAEDVDAIIGRLLLMYPLDPKTDVAGALSFGENYTSSLPVSRHRKIILITDGDAAGTQSLVDASNARLKASGVDLQYIKVPVTGNGPSSGRPAQTAQTAAPAKPAGQTASTAQAAPSGQPVSSGQTAAPAKAAPAGQASSATAGKAASPSQTTPSSQETAPGQAAGTGSKAASSPAASPPPEAPAPSQNTQAARPPAQPEPQGSGQGASSAATPPPTAATGGTTEAAIPPQPAEGQPSQGQSDQGQSGQSQSGQNQSEQSGKGTATITPPSQPAAQGTGQAAAPAPAAASSQEKAGNEPGFLTDIPLPLLIALILLALLILGLLIFFAARRLHNTPNRAMAQAAVPPPMDNRDRIEAERQERIKGAALMGSYAESQRNKPKPMPKDNVYNEAPVTEREGPLMLKLFVEDQNTAIGRRNIHAVKPGYTFSVGGGKSDFLIFLVPIPPHIADVQFDGSNCTFYPRKSQYFPDIGSQSVPNCIGKTIRVISDKRYELHIRIDRYQDPLKELNKMLHSIAMPGEVH